MSKRKKQLIFKIDPDQIWDFHFGEIKEKVVNLHNPQGVEVEVYWCEIDREYKVDIWHTEANEICSKLIFQTKEFKDWKKEKQ